VGKRPHPTGASQQQEGAKTETGLPQKRRAEPYKTHTAQETRGRTLLALPQQIKGDAAALTALKREPLSLYTTPATAKEDRLQQGDTSLAERGRNNS
jgi:hypothetical protein